MSVQTVIEGVLPPPAPQITTEMVKAAVMEYIGRHSLTQWGDPDQTSSDISKAWRRGMDGYELAKKLEDNFYWDGLCLQDAEDLDSIGLVVQDAEREARKAWAEEWNIKPPFPIGTQITRGVIASLHEYEAATYLVKQYGCAVEGRYLLVRFEDAKAKDGAA